MNDNGLCMWRVARDEATCIVNLLDDWELVNRIAFSKHIMVHVQWHSKLTLQCPWHKVLTKMTSHSITNEISPTNTYHSWHTIVEICLYSKLINVTNTNVSYITFWMDGNIIFAYYFIFHNFNVPHLYYIYKFHGYINYWKTNQALILSISELYFGKKNCKLMQWCRFWWHTFKAKCKLKENFNLGFSWFMPFVIRSFITN
jgi:hypothetical protein